MSAYPWMKRHKRYLSFRYIFPELAAAWIIFKRFLLRVLWFFTHPVDEFLDDLRDLLLWPFAALNTLWRWMIIGIHSFFSDLVRGIESAFAWMGGLPVWTGAAVSGVMGIILTILLFLLPAIDSSVTASISDATQPKVTPITQAAQFDIFQAPPAEPKFDPFAAPPQSHPVLPIGNFGHSQPSLQMELGRLDLPPWLKSREQMSVVSTPNRVDLQDLMQRFQVAVQYDQWAQRRFDRDQRTLAFTPYASQLGVRTTSAAPDWVQPEASVEPLNHYSTERHPTVVVEKTAPQHALIGQPMQYQLNVKNVGKEVLDSVRVREQMSDIERVSNTNPPSKIVGNTLVWDLSELQPGESRQLHIELQPNSEIQLAHKSAVQVTTRVAAVSDVRQPRPEPPRDPEPTPPPAGPAPEPPVSVLPEFIDDPEPEPLPQPEVEPMEFNPFDDLLPAEEEPATETLPPFESEPERTEESAVTEQPLRLEMFSPELVTTGGDVRTIFEIENRGGTDITDLVLAVELTEQLDHNKGPALELKIPCIAAGDVFRTRLTTEAVKDGTATLSSRLTSTATETLNAQRNVRISDEVQPPSDIVYELMPHCVPAPCGPAPF